MPKACPLLASAFNVQVRRLDGAQMIDLNMAVAAIQDHGRLQLACFRQDRESRLHSSLNGIRCEGLACLRMCRHASVLLHVQGELGLDSMP